MLKKIENGEFVQDEDKKNVVVVVYDNDINDTMEAVQEALDSIGAGVQITILAEDRERSDFLFEKVK
jgi:putative lipoic acid-binding regulatory protein